jgi:hypothetical protein
MGHSAHLVRQCQCRREDGPGAIPEGVGQHLGRLPLASGGVRVPLDRQENETDDDGRTADDDQHIGAVTRRR